MFPYDPQIAAAVQNPPNSIAEVLALMQTIDDTCQVTDGLKWFNWLYMSVTQAVKAKVDVGAFQQGAWLTELDVQFASLYFTALYAELSGGNCPACWDSMFSKRNQVNIARIQFALAGMNAHINHDLPMAIVATCKVINAAPQHGTPQYADYTAINPILDGLIDTAKKNLNVRLPGDPLPGVSHVEDAIAAWDMAGFREQAWNTAQSLWGEPAAMQAARMDVIDTLVAGMNQLLLIPAPLQEAGTKGSGG
jgi:Family of unknown function (DUF5995)